MIKSFVKLSVLFISGVILSACQTAKLAENAATLEVDFSWNETKSCSPVSPAFTINNIPEGTDHLSFKMKDMNVPSYQHGGGTVKYAGSNDIPAGAFGYRGPCPPAGSHNYKWTVQAVNAAGDTILGQGAATKPFPPN
ncbi:MAG: phospholipid-binding protein [Methylocystaceae bacterium]|nr:phospholipid-binding protein [Methylocystaceae bacterium]